MAGRAPAGALALAAPEAGVTVRAALWLAPLPSVAVTENCPAGVAAGTTNDPPNAPASLVAVLAKVAPLLMVTVTGDAAEKPEPENATLAPGDALLWESWNSH